MTISGPVTSRQELMSRFAAMRRDGGTPSDFEREVRQLAADATKRLHWGPVLELARVGWESYAQPGVGTDLPPVFTGDQLERDFEQAVTGEVEPERWGARLRGFQSGGKSELTPSAAGTGDLDAFVHGQMLRWMVDNHVPVLGPRMLLADNYATGAVDFLVVRAAKGKKSGVVNAHFKEMYAMRLGYGTISLVEELVFFAWLLDQHDQSVELAPFLELRDKWLAELPPAAS